MKMLPCKKIIEAYETLGMRDVPHVCFTISPWRDLDNYYTDGKNLYYLKNSVP